MADRFHCWKCLAPIRGGAGVCEKCAAEIRSSTTKAVATDIAPVSPPNVAHEVTAAFREAYDIAPAQPAVPRPPKPPKQRKPRAPRASKPPRNSQSSRRQREEQNPVYAIFAVVMLLFAIIVAAAVGTQ
jgi:hypothetical protein